MSFFDNIPQVKYEGRDSKNPFAFKYYDPNRVILGKTMEEHLPFAMAWWHNLCANGVDMFGVGTTDKSFGCVPGTMEHAKAKVDAGIEFMQKLGIKYYCFHDVDIVPRIRRTSTSPTSVLTKSRITSLKRQRAPTSSVSGPPAICSAIPVT